MALYRIVLVEERFSQAQALVEQWLGGKAGKDQIAYFYHEAIEVGRTNLARNILDVAIRRGHMSQDDAGQMRRDAQG